MARNDKTKKREPKRAELEALMNDRGIPSIGNLAARVGLSNSAISMLFSGGMRPSATTAANICYELGVEPPRLYDLLDLRDVYRLEKTIEVYRRGQGHVSLAPAGNGPQIMHEMYTMLVQRLTLRYEACAPFEKIGILSTLDNLVRKYQRTEASSPLVAAVPEPEKT